MDLNYADPSRDAPQTRKYDLGTNTVIARRMDPYGFIKLNYERGSIPEGFSGVYTSWARAEEAVAQLKAERDRAEMEKVENQRPKIKFKPVKEEAVAA